MPGLVPGGCCRTQCIAGLGGFKPIVFPLSAEWGRVARRNRGRGADSGAHAVMGYWQSQNKNMADILIVVVAYLITTTWETLIHWKLLHATKRSRLVWRKLGGIGGVFRRAYFAHTIIHHERTFKAGFFTQFGSEDERLKLNQKLPVALRDRIVKNRYGLSISSFLEMATFVAVPVLVNTGVVLLLWDIGMLPVVWLISIAPALLSRYVHPQLHKAGVGQAGGNLWDRYLEGIREYHRMHHEYGLVNFNLLPGGDYVLGVACKKAGRRK